MKSYTPALKKPLYYRIVKDEFNMDFSTQIVGYEKCTKAKAEVELKKNLYIIHFVLSGKGYIKFNNKKDWVEISKDHCFLISPGEKTTYRPDKEDPWSYFWMEFSGNLAKKMVEMTDFQTNSNILKVHNTKAIRKVINKIFNEESIKISSLSETLRIQSLVFSIFSILINEYYKEEIEQKNNNTEKQISVITKYINSNYSSPDLTVQKLADEFAYNPSYLSRIFKQYNGISPAKYIIVQRMRAAIDMLNENRYTISQIAYALGYKNQFYFSKEFKRYYGVPPTEYFKN